MKKLFTLAALLISGMAFSQSLYWEEPNEKTIAAPADPTTALFADNSGGTASFSAITETETAAAQTSISFKGIVQMYEAYESIDPPASSTQSAPVVAPHVKLYGCSPFQDSLWSLDTTTGFNIVTRLGPTLPSFTITGMNGMAFDPCTFETYIIMKVSAVTGRVLGKIDLNTGVCTQVGNLGDNFSSITFGPDGQLYGCTGDGATVPEALYKIDKTNGTKTLMYAMGSGQDGEVINYNIFDNFIYHWSGNGTVVYEKMAAANVTYTPTNIPIIGTTNGETFGSICVGPNKFIVSNISSSFNRFATTGQVSSPFGSNPDDLRGLVIKPDFATNGNTFCAEIDTMKIASVGTNIYGYTTYLNWGDGDIDTIPANANTSASGMHTYTTGGNYTVSVILDNGVCTANTYTTFNVTINALPVVTFSGDAVLCPSESTTLNSIPGVSYQWFMNGAMMASETSSTVTTSTAGVYNVIVADANGCYDSASVGYSVISVPNPTVALGPDTTVCGGIILDAANAGSAYDWQDNSTLQTFDVSASGTYSVTVTDTNGCAGNDAVSVTVNALPLVNIGNDTTVCGSIIVDAGNPGAMYLWCDGSTTQTTTLNSSGTCAVNVTDANGCSSSDTITVIVNPNPTVNLGPDTTNCGCITLNAGAGFMSYTWCDNSISQTVTLCVSNSCAVMVVDSNGCVGSDTIAVTVNTPPTVTASASPSSVCSTDANVTLTGAPAGGTFSGPGVSGNSFDPSIGVGVQSIIYNYTDANGCSGSDTTQVTVNACVGIAEQGNISTINVYPNPGSGLFTIQLNDAATVNVFDGAGQLVGSYKMAAGTQQIDGTSWAAGIYTMQAVTGTSVAQVRLVITK